MRSSKFVFLAFIVYTSCVGEYVLFSLPIVYRFIQFRTVRSDGILYLIANCTGDIPFSKYSLIICSLIDDGYELFFVLGNNPLTPYNLYLWYFSLNNLRFVFNDNIFITFKKLYPCSYKSKAYNKVLIFILKFLFILKLIAKYYLFNCLLNREHIKDSTEWLFN